MSLPLGIFRVCLPAPTERIPFRGDETGRAGRPGDVEGGRLVVLMGWPGIRLRHVAQQPQQTGVPFIITQQVQPAFIMVAQQSQHRLDHGAAVFIAAGAGDAAPVFGHLALAHAHHHVARADHHSVHHHAARDHAAGEHGAEVLHHGEQAILSSVLQVIFILPSHFSMLIVRRGTIIMFMPVGIAEGVPIIRPCSCPACSSSAPSAPSVPSWRSSVGISSFPVRIADLEARHWASPLPGRYRKSEGQLQSEFKNMAETIMTYFVMLVEIGGEWLAFLGRQDRTW